MRQDDELHLLLAKLWGEYSSAKVADAILAAGFRKPRVVTTAAELDALPVGSVVLDSDGDAWQNRGYADLNWCCTTYGRNFGMNAVNLFDRFGPVTLLHEPEEER